MSLAPMTWAAEAACRQHPTDLWFPDRDLTWQENRARVDSAVSVCRRCPVLAACRSYALDDGMLGMPDTGIWGGLTAWERLVIQRNRRRNQGAATAERMVIPAEEGDRN